MTATPGPVTVEAPHSTEEEGYPGPERERWQPLRIGLVDVFHYDTEEFWFRDGRLLLRGNNGTGKSKVLALTLPFLLDGELSARRVEPDGDPNKRMEWNLLLGGEHPHSERLGYTWIEFGRRDEQGEAHYRTLACGLKAVANRGIARHWFLVTDQRVGVELDFLDATGTALGRDRLLEAVAGRGTLYDRARDYRRAVDEALFGLGERRYHALVDLLVQLRQPQLSKRPNEAALSRALTEALPPMDQAVVADVAVAFRELDEQKTELQAALEAERAASAFLTDYRRYAGVAARRRAQLPRREHSRYEQYSRDLAAAERDHATAQEEQRAAQRELTELRQRAATLEAAETELQTGPEMRSKQELQQASAVAERERSAEQRAAEDQRRAEAERVHRAERVRVAQERVEGVAQHVDEVRQRVDAAAEEARLEPLQTVDDAGSEEQLRRTTEESIARRGRTVDHLAELHTAAQRAADERAAAARRSDEAEGEHARASEAAERAQESVAQAGAALVAGVRAHLDGCTELDVPDGVGLLDRLTEWTRHLDGANPAAAEVGAAHRRRAGQLADEAATLRGSHAVLAEQRDVLQEELATLAGGKQSAPAPPHTRDATFREHADGAPLWRLVDFQDGCEPAERAGFEAALEAAGLLDAWLAPDGTVLGADTYDVLLAPTARPCTPSLADVLRPAPDHGDARAAAVAEETIARVLAQVGAAPEADTESWVAADGRFRLGAATGRWSKQAAEYLGEGAREEARRARMATVRQELQESAGELARLDAALAECEERRRTLDEEHAALPDDTPLRTACADTAAARQAKDRATARRAERAAEASEAARKAEAAHTETAERATELGLPAEAAALAEVRRALQQVQVLLAQWWPARGEHAAATEALHAAQTEAEAAGERVAELAARLAEAAEDRATAEARYETLNSTVGAAVAEVQRRLDETKAARRACTEAVQAASSAERAAGEQAVRADERIALLGQSIEEATSARAEAIAQLRAFAETGLLTVALPEVELPAPDAGAWSVTSAIALARTIESELSRVDCSDGDWERVQRRVDEEYKALQDALARNGHEASARVVEGALVVTVRYQGRERQVAELCAALTTEVADLQRILSAHEREILETHILHEVAGNLQDLIDGAEREVQRMNEELAERPTSTGMRLRLVWRPSRQAPAGLAQVREVLRRSADAWSPADRTAVGAFLQTQMTTEQSTDAAGSWVEHLTSALDYRGWHEFGIERYQNGRWVSATGPASGGERVLAVSVPLFAAASSHFATAAPHAPRLVTLDEAFAGVDDDARAKCLGLLRAFDLDVVMTSEREWACYPQVPGIAIAHLSRTDELAAVLVSRWEWDGHERTHGAEPPRGAGELGTAHASQGISQPGGAAEQTLEGLW